MKKIFILCLCNLFCLFIFGNEPNNKLVANLTIDNISSTDASCIADDGTATVTTSGGTPPLVYAWENLANTGTTVSITNPATGLAAGAYSVTVNDADGCTAMRTVVVGMPPAPFILGIDNTTQQPSCGSNDGAIILSVEDALGPFTYNWENSMNPGTSISTDNPIIDLAAGMYNVTITGNNGCTTSVTIPLVASDAPEIETMSSTSTCGQANGGAVVIVNIGTMPYTYNWENSIAPGTSVSTSEVASNLVEGTYNVVVTDANGCTAFATATVDGTPPLTFDTSSIDPTCSGAMDGSAVVDADGGSFYYTYLWSNGSIEETAINLPVGIHTVTVTDTEGCVGTTQVELTAPEEIFFTATSSSACSGTNSGSIIVQGVSGGVEPYTYSSDGIDYFMDSILLNLSEGLYDVYVEDATGCIGTIQVEVSASDEVFFETTSTNATCSGKNDGTITVLNVSGGNPPYLYSDDGFNYSSNNIFIGLEEGLYDIYVQDDNGCVKLENQLVENTIELILDYGEDEEIDYGESVVLNPMANFPLDTTLYTWTWAPDTTLIFNNSSYNPTVQPSATTTYSVTVMNIIDSCSVSDAITVRVNIERDVFIPNIFSPNLDDVNDIFTVFGGIGVARILRMQVFNRWGAKMHEAANFPPNDSSYGWNGRHRGNPVSQGVYVYYIEVEFVDGTLDTYRGDVTVVR